MLQRITALTSPVTLEEIKAHIPVNGDDNDDNLEQLLLAATDLVEKSTNRSLTEETVWVEILPKLPDELLKNPVISIDSFEVDGVSFSDYSLISYTYVPCAISYTTLPAVENNCTIQYTAGENNPICNLCIKELVKYWYLEKEPPQSFYFLLESARLIHG